MSKEPQVHYWDSAVFITYMVGKDQEQVDAIEQLIADFEARPPRIRVVVSTLARAELLHFSGNDLDHVGIVEEMLSANRDNLTLVSVDDYIADEARILASQYRQLSVPDAIHLATALSEGAEYFLTYDGWRKDDPNRKGTGDADKKRNRNGKLMGFDRLLGAPQMRVCIPHKYLGRGMLEQVNGSQAEQPGEDLDITHEVGDPNT